MYEYRELDARDIPVDNFLSKAISRVNNSLIQVVACTNYWGEHLKYSRDLRICRYQRQKVVVLPILLSEKRKGRGRDTNISVSKTYTT